MSKKGKVYLVGVGPYNLNLNSSFLGNARYTPENYFGYFCPCVSDIYRLSYLLASLVICFSVGIA
jgi:hypothetical protein